MPLPLELTVRSLMNPNPVRVAPDQSVRAALDLMNEHRIGAMVVADDQDRVVGIFTERDFLRRASRSPADLAQVPISDWMSPYPYTIHPDAGWEEAVASMERLRVRHLPVVADSKLVGIVTTRQLVAHRAEHFLQIVSERTRELRRANEALMARDSEVTHYMKAAARLQKRLFLPQAPPDWPEVGWGINYSPLDPLGGDLYGFSRPDDDHIGVLVADASGHGIPAAMIAILTWQAFTESARQTVKPGEVLAAMNHRLQDMSDERFVTAFYGVLNRKTRRFTYANAGHPFPIWYSAERQACLELTARGFLLGVMPEEVYVEKSVDMGPGDRVCLYTDGVADCRDERGEAFGADRLQELVCQNTNMSAAEWTTSVVTALREFRGTAKPIDDMTFVAAEIK